MWGSQGVRRVMGDKVREALDAGLLPGNASEMSATVLIDGRRPHLPHPSVSEMPPP